MQQQRQRRRRQRSVVRPPPRALRCPTRRVSARLPRRPRACSYLPCPGYAGGEEDDFTWAHTFSSDSSGGPGVWGEQSRASSCLPEGVRARPPSGGPSTAGAPVPLLRCAVVLDLPPAGRAAYPNFTPLAFEALVESDIRGPPPPPTVAKAPAKAPKRKRVASDGAGGSGSQRGRKKGRPSSGAPAAAGTGDGRHGRLGQPTLRQQPRKGKARRLSEIEPPELQQDSSPWRWEAAAQLDWGEVSDADMGGAEAAEAPHARRQDTHQPAPSSQGEASGRPSQHGGASVRSGGGASGASQRVTQAAGGSLGAGGTQAMHHRGGAFGGDGGDGDFRCGLLPPLLPLLLPACFAVAGGAATTPSIPPPPHPPWLLPQGDAAKPAAARAAAEAASRLQPGGRPARGEWSRPTQKRRAVRLHGREGG